MCVIRLSSSSKPYQAVMAVVLRIHDTGSCYDLIAVNFLFCCCQMEDVQVLTRSSSGRPDLNTVLTKLHIFRLTQFSKIIFLDADVLPVRPLSHLFNIPHEFSAVPDVGWPDIFNSGVLVLSPSEAKFTEVTQLLKTKGSWDGGDQGVLNEWRGGDWNRLSFTYNTTPTAAYTFVLSCMLSLRQVLIFTFQLCPCI